MDTSLFIWEVRLPIPREKVGLQAEGERGEIVWINWEKKTRKESECNQKDTDVFTATTAGELSSPGH